MAKPKFTACKTCGERIKQQSGRGKIKRFCSPGCRPSTISRIETPYKKKQSVFKCIECGVLFLRVPGGKVKWCSDGCTPVAQRTWWKQTNTVCTCINCGQPYIPRTAHAIKKYCSANCATKFSKQRGAERPCVECGEVFQPMADTTGKYCSNKCGVKAGGRLRVLRSGAFSRVHYGNCRVCDSVIGPRKSDVTVACKECLNEFGQAAYTAQVSLLLDRRNGRKCITCGETFTPFSQDSLTCSPKCYRRTEKYKAARSVYKGKRRAAKHNNGPYENIDPLDVLEKDKWRCYICGVSTPKRLRGSLDDRAPEMDHVIPLSAGGTHTRDNVRCCCRSCNQEKGAKIYQTDMFIGV